MPTYLAAALLTLSAAALSFSVYLAVTPRPAGLLNHLPVMTWHLLAGGLAALCATLAAMGVLLVVPR